MLTKTITVSHLRERIRAVLNEVGYGQADYVIEKFGEPVAAFISMENYRLLQELKEQADATRVQSAFTSELEAIHAMLAASGYQPRSREEIDAEIRAERDSWGD